MSKGSYGGQKLHMYPLIWQSEAIDTDLYIFKHIPYLSEKIVL